MTNSKLIGCVLAFLLNFGVFGPTAAAEKAPPAAPVREVTETYFGQTVVDPYRWMENTKDPELVAWLKAQDDLTRTVLAKIPGRAQLAERIRALDNAGVSVSSLQWVPGHYFYFKTEPGSDNRKLFVRESLQGPERLLIDPEKRSKQGQHVSIDFYTPSLDGTYVAAGLSVGGSENSTLEVLETKTARTLSDRIDRTQFGAIAWRQDGKSFFYNRLAKLGPDAPPTAKYQKSMAYLHVLGADPDKEPPLLGYGLAPSVALTVDDFPFVAYSPASPYVLGGVAHGVQNEVTIYAARFDALAGAKTAWRKVVDVDDAVTRFDIRGDTLYLLTHKDASRFKVVTLNLAAPDSHTAPLVAPSEVVITGVSVAKDALYVQDLDGGLGRLRRVAFEGGKIENIPMPFEGAISSVVTDPRMDGALVHLTSWTKSPVWYAWDPRAGMSDTKLAPPSPVDYSGIDSAEVKAKSADGTMVPLSIIFKKGIAFDGSHPTLLDGYGAYGITIDPGFSPTRLAWLERGGVFAYAHVRGGGEYGEDWHLGGKLGTKQHTIDDFLACAQYLIDNKYTSSRNLGGEGTSAGGITIGGAMTQRPELFGAALVRVGDSDALRSEMMESGPANIPEFGTVKTEEGFKALYAMDAYQHVKAGTPYPAVLLTTGANDPRVAPWQAAKMTARLQAATSSGKPVLLRVDYDAGHGIGSTKSQRDEELSDEEAFLLWQFGVPEFQIR
jgi:prolyl oligopeptidase